MPLSWSAECRASLTYATHPFRQFVFPRFIFANTSLWIFMWLLFKLSYFAMELKLKAWNSLISVHTWAWQIGSFLCNFSLLPPPPILSSLHLSLLPSNILGAHHRGHAPVACCKQEMNNSRAGGGWVQPWRAKSHPYGLRSNPQLESH